MRMSLVSAGRTEMDGPADSGSGWAFKGCSRTYIMLSLTFLLQAYQTIMI